MLAEPLSYQIVPEEESQAPQLVIDQGIHWVEEQGAHSASPEAVAGNRLVREAAEDRQQECLRLAGACSGCDHEIAKWVRQCTFEGFRLMVVWRIKEKFVLAELR
jgi:hypothetical protein